VGEDGVGVSNDLTPMGAVLPWFDKRPQAKAAILQHQAHLSVRAGIALTQTAPQPNGCGSITIARKKLKLSTIGSRSQIFRQCGGQARCL
jgi:hypothetical protein